MEKTREIEQYLRWKFKLRVLEFAKDCGKVKKTCEMFNVSRSSYFNWKRKYEKDGAEGLFFGKAPPPAHCGRQLTRRYGGHGAGIDEGV